MLEISGSPGPQCPPSSTLTLWEGKKGKEEEATRRPPQLTQIPRPWALCSAKSLAGYSGRAQLVPSLAGFKEDFPTSAGGPPGLSTQGLGCMLGQEAGPQSRMDTVDQVMKPQGEMCLPLCSHKGHTSASSDHKLIIPKES